MAENSGPLLELDSLVTGYGKKQVLNDVSLTVRLGEIVALIGHNGAGKSTLLKTVFGLVPVWKGQVTYNSELLDSSKPRDLLRRGMAYIPQGNRVFAQLTVRENLEIGGVTLPNRTMLNEAIERALSMFPVLRSRVSQRASTLSGGEKQMLALANALVLSPRLLLLDEPSLGLAPSMVGETLGRIQRLNRDEGVSILVVEQKVREVLKICHQVCCLKLGRVTFCGPPTEFANDTAKLKQLFL